MQKNVRQHTSNRYRFVRFRWRVLFAIVDTVGTFLFALIYRIQNILQRLHLRQKDDKSNNPRAILLIQLDHLGDAILTTTMLRPLRRCYPRARIEVLASPWNREVFEALAEVDRVHVSGFNRFQRGGPAWKRAIGGVIATFYWGLVLRRRRFDLAIDVRGEFPLALIAWLCGAKQRLGWNCGGGGFLMTEIAPYVPNRPEVLSRRALLNKLSDRFSEPSSSDEAKPFFTPPAKVRQLIAHRMTGLNLLKPDERPWFVVHVGAGSAAKRWPVEHWRLLIEQMLKQYDARVVLVGGSGEQETAAAIQAGGEATSILDWTGRLSLVELSALLEQADLFLGADSGPAHLAAAVGTPTVVLFSGTNQSWQWRPWGEKVAVVRYPVACGPCHRTVCAMPEHGCMRGLKPEMVATEVARCWSVWEPSRQKEQNKNLV